ncbi:MAG TPA: Hpt domain-containing protein [Gammaproteobacteria bacterium]|nr:Hpt domain-containing protein [Gammaproteobacteria bacterium]
MNQVASDSLLWIKTDLDGVLVSARQALEAYAEDRQDQTALGHCLEHLHQIQGTLRIVEVYGAAMLAEEMEAVARGIHDGAIKPTDEVFEVLMRAILQLPDYLERVINGRRDMPLALLSLLNDLRSVRNQPLLSESALFAHQLQDRGVQLPQMPTVAAAKSVDLRDLARRLRPKFQTELLSWYKNDKAAQPLARMAAIIEQFEQAASKPPVFELWWIVGGALEALRDGGLEASVSLKQMLGQVDRQIKRLTAESESEFAAAPPRELINNLLYYVGRATSTGERVSGIKKSFSLNEFLPEEAQVAEAREALSGPNAQLMRTVSAAIKEDLTQVKDSLDIFVRTGRRNIADLVPLAELLKKVGDTLAVLGLGALRSELAAHTGALQGIAAGEQGPEEAVLMEVAQALLRLEVRLDDDMGELVAADRAAAPESPTGSEYKETFGAVIRESIVNLARIKEAITEYARGESNTEAIGHVSEHMRQVQAGLNLLNLDRPARVLDNIRRYVEQQIVKGTSVPPADSLDRMADALVSVEFYLETVQSGRGDPQSMLDNAEACVAALDIPAEAAPAAKPAAVVQPAPVAAEAPPAPKPAPLPNADEVDPEILEVFLEEAHEEIARLQEYFPRWRANLQDRDALVVVRRSFHTLKGSGRMVGAGRIGEFAWALENMLNRVIDATIEPREAVVELVGQALAALPELIEELEAGQPPAVDVEVLVRRAEALAHGEEPESFIAVPESEPPPVETAPPAVATQAETKTDVAPAPEPDKSAHRAVEPAMDPVLYDIFSKEIAAHLTTITDFLDKREQGGAGIVDKELVRALHTLKGSAHTANAEAIWHLADPAERAAKSFAVVHDPLPADAAAALREMVEAIERLVPGYASPGGVQSDYAELAARIAALRPSPAEQSDEPTEYSALYGIETALDEEPPESSVGEAAETATAEAVPEPSSAPEPQSESAAPAPDYGSDTEFDPELATIFFEEAKELLEAIDVAMQGWYENRTDDTFVADLQRHLHTFKGGARMAGLMPLGDLSHNLETLLSRIADGRIPVSDRMLKTVQRVIDRLHQMLEVSIGGRLPPPATDLVEELEHLQRRGAQEPAEASVGTTHPAAEAEKAEPETTVAEAVARPAPEEDRRSGSRIQPELMRVRADLLESALNHAGEVSIYRSRLEQQLSTMNFNLAELDQTVERLREQLRKFEIEAEAQIVFQHEQEAGDDRGDFDPLELDRYSQLQQLSRSLMESVGDLVSIQALLSNQARETETLLLQQSRVTTELQDGLMRTRMVPFSSHAQRLRRVVRQAAQEVRKNAELRLSGAEGEMDRQVLERVLAPLEHMLRNAVVHGIEAPAERQKQGKPQTGQITIGLHREGAEVVINIIDDGAGLDLNAIRAQAVARGLVGADVELSESDIMQFIFESGFSTAKEVTLSAGRGVGMDVVASEVKQLGGTLAIDSVAGAGTNITIRLPFTLAITQALMVIAGEETFAIPLPAIEGIARIPGRDLKRFFAGELQEFTYGGREYRLQHLSTLLGFAVPEVEEAQTSCPVLLVRSGDFLGALIAESMQGSREVVVKSIGPQIASIRGISGATILGDGSILLILDPSSLLRAPVGGRTEAPRAERARQARKERQRLVMVVDDSITVRRVTQRLLERYGMRVETAKDGVDALTQLQEFIPHVILLDIEMPRMDGYELTANLRNDERLRDVPIVMITSRTGDKHRNRAMELGVNDYLGKPYQEADLLAAIERHAKAPAEE